MILERAKVTVTGAVQGVGFRPFVYRLATELQLTGWVLNSSQGVFIEVEGPRDSLDTFLRRLEADKPSLAVIQSLEFSFLDPVHYEKFEIRFSKEAGTKTALILPDIATCKDCLGDIFDRSNRRYLYPFTNCTNCGPRYSIIESLPYDRPSTSMKQFTMCPECAAEYENPANRRFHAQPNACPGCGPHVELWDSTGGTLASPPDALTEAAEAVRSGRILALKGIGGFQLIVDARDEEAVRRLRERKHREEKPFAVMYPGLDAAQLDCRISEREQRLLLSPESPIVLLERLADAAFVAASVAPRNPYLGVMLPYTPLHHILMRMLEFPIVATSGNLSDEPICIDEHEALERLKGIADVFLVHNRPIVRHVDDSVVRIILDRELIMRRARGYAPMPVHLKEPLPNILAVGAHLKNAVALSVGSNAFISQHIGDLETSQAFEAFQKVVADLQHLYDATPEYVAIDMHPEYLSTKFAQQLSRPIIPIQHHFAHVAACMAENELEPPVLGVSWDGTGFGPDGTIWGGEFLLANDTAFQRVARFRQFRLPGGDTAVKQPRRTAAGLLYEVFGSSLFERHDLAPLNDFAEGELALISQMLSKRINAPLTSSVGRLFDAVSAIAALRQRVSFEGQAAMELEFSIQHGVNESFPIEVHDGEPMVVDWQPLILALLHFLHEGQPVGVIAAQFHNALAEAIVKVAHRIREPKIVLTGGCFQNKYLTERAIQRLREEGFRPYWHQRVPTNDGGIALGQIAAAAREVRQEKEPQGLAFHEPRLR